MRRVIDVFPPLVGEQYLTAHHDFRAKSDQHQIIVKWVEDNIYSSFIDDKISILSIGCGDGCIDFDIARLFLGKNVSVNYSFLEPNNSSIAKLKISMSNDASISRQVRSIYYNDTIESAQLEGKFDIIFFTHSMYHLFDREHALRKSLDHLRKDGKIIIVCSTDKGVVELKKNVYSSLSLKLSRPLLVPSSINQLLDLLDLEYSSVCLSSKLDFTDWEELGLSSSILPFLFNTNIDHLPKSVGRVIKNEISALLTVEDGKMLLEHPLCFYTV